MKTRLCLIISLILVSCNSKEIPTSSSENIVTGKDYFPITIGSYWIYAFYDADTSWSTFTFAFEDSVVILKDTTINGKTYAHMKRRFMGDIFVRDSSGIIVRSDGLPIMSITPGKTLLNNYTFPSDTLMSMDLRMATQDSTFNVPAGQFLAKYVIGSLDSKENIGGWRKHRSFTVAFAKNVGEVYQRAHWVGSGGGFDIRLLRYSIK